MSNEAPVTSALAASLGARPPLPPPHAKIAIPRQRSNVAQKHSRRVPRACESCRIRKTKCSGDTPVCRQCRDVRAICVYPPGMRERMKRQQEEISKRLQDCQSLLKEAEAFVPGRTAKRIKEFLLESDSGYVSNDVSSERTLPADKFQEAADEQASEPSSVGSLDALDKVEYDVNLNNQSRATGYIGKGSEITWMQRVQKETEQRRRSQSGLPDPSGGDEDNTTSHVFAPPEMNYHLDDFDIGVSEPVQMYWVPSRPLADKLFETYLRVAHPYFPIINRPLFCDQYGRFFDSFALPGDKWMAILNMVFAIAANYAHVAQLEWRGNPQDHLLYLTRARMLSMSGDEVFRHPDLQQVQVEGLMAFYLVSTDQIHRAWRISALAIRSAISLGINLKSSNQMISNVSKEIRNRVWWSLIATENKLGLMTGRPTCISVSMCIAPLPLPFEENNLQEQPATSLLNDPGLRDKHVNNAMASSYLRKTHFGNSNNERDIPSTLEWLHRLPVSPGLYFLYSCDLTMLMQGLLDRVYAANAVHQPWRNLKDRIGEIQARVDLWISSLPRGLDFTRTDDADQGSDEKRRLAFQYYSARIMLGRPCLCRHHKNDAQKHSNEEQAFTQAMAVSTIESAVQMAHLIPDESDAGLSAEVRPWWCLLHYVMQTLTVIILELSFSSVHMPKEEGNLLQLAKKCIRWLARTSKHSVASHRAWQLCDSALRRLAEPLGFDVSDLPSPHYEPGQHVHLDPLGFPAMEGHVTAVDDNPIPEFIMADPVEGSYGPLSMPPAGPSVGSRTNPPFSAAGHGVGEGSFAHDPISESFVEFFFP